MIDSHNQLFFSIQKYDLSESANFLQEAKLLAQKINQRSCIFSVDLQCTEQGISLVLKPYLDLRDLLSTSILYCKKRGKAQYLSKKGKAMSFTEFTTGLKFKKVALEGDVQNPATLQKLQNLFIENFKYEAQRHVKLIQAFAVKYGFITTM